MAPDDAYAVLDRLNKLRQQKAQDEIRQKQENEEARRRRGEFRRRLPQYLENLAKDLNRAASDVLFTHFSAEACSNESNPSSTTPAWWLAFDRPGPQNLNGGSAMARVTYNNDQFFYEFQSDLKKNGHRFEPNPIDLSEGSLRGRILEDLARYFILKESLART